MASVFDGKERGLRAPAPLGRAWHVRATLRAERLVRRVGAGEAPSLPSAVTRTVQASLSTPER